MCTCLHVCNVIAVVDAVLYDSVPSGPGVITCHTCAQKVYKVKHIFIHMYTIAMDLQFVLYLMLIVYGLLLLLFAYVCMCIRMP